MIPAPLRALLLAVALSSAPVAAHAQSVPPDTARIARLRAYADRIEALGFSGQLLVAEQGRVVFEQACGRSDRRYGRRMRPDTRIAVGSVTKSFVAAAVLTLESAGRLRLADRLADHVDGVPEDKATITLAQLLSHQSGLPFDIPDGLATSSRDEVVSAILAQSLEFAPGARFGYSNAAYDLLAAIVERVSKSPFDAYLRRELLTKGGLIASGIAGAPGLPAGHAAIGYGPWGEVSAWNEWPAGWSGTGSGRMVMTARDLWQWAESLRSGRVIGAEHWQRMQAEHARIASGRAYGLGVWRHELADGRLLLVMGGDVPGYRAECRILPKEDRVVVVLTNRDLEDGGLERQIIAGTLSQIARGGEPELPPPVVAASATQATSPEGLWRLPGGAHIALWREHGRLVLAPRGQEAVELFEPDGAEGAALRARYHRASEVLVRAAVLEDSALAGSVLTAEEHARVFPFLRNRLRVLRALHAPLLEVNGMGVVSTPGDDATFRSHVAVRFERRSESLELLWSAGELQDATFSPERPGARVLGVAPLLESGYVAWDASRARAITLRMRRESDGSDRLVVSTAAGDVVATRVR